MHYTLEQLSRLTGVSVRMIRGLVQRGEIPKARGKLAGGNYTDEHIGAITNYLRRQRMIAELRNEKQASRLIEDA